MYAHKFSDLFQARLSSKKKKDQIFVNAIRNSTQKLLLNPYNNDSWLKGELAGKHKKYVGGRSGYRVIFAICEECRTREDQQFNDCPWCSETGNKTVVFFNAFRRKEGYD